MDSDQMVVVHRWAIQCLRLNHDYYLQRNFVLLSFKCFVRQWCRADRSLWTVSWTPTNANQQRVSGITWLIAACLRPRIYTAVATATPGIINQTQPVVFRVFQHIPSRCIRLQALRLTYTYLDAPPTRLACKLSNARYTVHFMQYQVSFRRTHPGPYVRKLS